MEKESNKSYIITMIVGILCLIVVVFSVTYAYFRPRITGEGKPIEAIAGTVKLSISESKITANALAPIRDTSKDTKAQKNTFTISRTEDSNLGACYALYLVVDEIGSAMQNEYFKYELDYGADTPISGDFSNLTFDEEGKASIGLLVNQEITDSKPQNSYTLRLWLSYDPDVDQTSLITGDATTRTFKGHVYASGKSGVCEVQGN